MIKRYSVWHSDISTYENDDGEWVRWDDVKDLAVSNLLEYDDSRGLYAVTTALSVELVKDMEFPVQFVDSVLKKFRRKILFDLFGIEETDEQISSVGDP